MESGREIRTLSGNSISGFTLSPDGRYILGHENHTLKIWEVPSGKEILSLNDAKVGSFSPNGRYILSTSKNKMLNLWEMATGQKIRTFSGQGHTTGVLSLQFSPDGLYAVSIGFDNCIKLWKVATGKEVKTFVGHTDKAVNSVAFSPDGRYIIYSDRSQCRFLELQTGRESQSFTAKAYYADGLGAVSFSPDSRYIVTGGSALKLLETATGREIRTFIDYRKDNRVSCVAFSPDGRYILSGGGALKLWDVSTGLEVRAFKGHASEISSVNFSSDNRYIISGSRDRTIKLWELETGREIRLFSGKTNYVNNVDLSPDGKIALIGGGTGVNLWEIATGRKLRNFAKGSHGQFSPDGHYILTQEDNNTITLRDAITGQQSQSYLGHTDYVTSLSFSPDGRYFLSGSLDKTVRLWDVSTRKETRKFVGHIGSRAVGFVAYSPDSRHVLSADNRDLKLWNVTTGEELQSFSGEPGYDNRGVFSPDGRYVLSDNDKTLKLWEVTTGQKVRSFEGSSPMAFSPDGRYVLSSSGMYDFTLTLWETNSGKKIRTFAGRHDGWIKSVKYSFDGRFALSGSSDGTSILWNVVSGEQCAKFVDFGDGEWIVITPEGYFNASPNGAKHLNVRVGNNVFAVDQFYSRFYRPDLVQIALAGKELPRTENFADIATSRPAPTVKIVSEHSSVIDEEEYNLSVNITDNGGGIGTIGVYLNGSQVANETRGVVIKAKESAKERFLNFTIPLVAGSNELRVIAFNRDSSMESNPATLTVISRATLKKSSLHAIVVGIDKYKNEGITLKYAAADATAFADTLKKRTSGLFDQVNIKLLTGFDETSRESISKAFTEIRDQVKPNDLFVFYDASHGIIDVADDQEQYYLITSNVLLLSSHRIAKDAISQKELATLIGSIPAQKKLVILDTCNSGKGGSEIQVALLQQTRGLTEATAAKLLQRAVGSTVFAASSSSQQALEGYNGHGLFTYILNEGLNGKADAKKDGFITVNSLAEYVEDEVVRLSKEVFKRQQTPTIQIGANFPVAKVK